MAKNVTFSLKLITFVTCLLLKAFYKMKFIMKGGRGIEKQSYLYHFNTIHYIPIFSTTILYE